MSKRKTKISASRRAFTTRYGPMEVTTGYGRDIDDYASNQLELWQAWEAGRKWQIKHPKEK